jgi:PAS domain S-box-containing protein
MKETAGLPKALSYYNKSDYSTQQKVSIFYYLCIAGIVGVCFLMLSLVIVHLRSSFQQIQLSILVIEFGTILVFILCLRLLIKGRFSLSAQLFLLAANIAAWIVILISKADTIARIDTIFLILALVSAIPLLLNTIKYSIFLYVGANIIFITIFFLSHQHELSISSSELIALVTDLSIAFLFTGLAGFQILRINERSLRRAETDNLKLKKADEALRESKQLFQTLAQVSPTGIFRTRIDGYTTYVNPKWIELSGLKLEEALGDGWIKAVHPDDREMLKENWVQHSNKGKKSKAEYRFIKDDGSIVWVLGYAVPEIVDGKIKGYVGTITDITERKQAEKELQESEERYRTIIGAFPDIIMISDLKKNIIFANDKLEKITGITKDDFTNPDRKAHIHPDDSHIVQKAIVDLLKGDRNQTDIIENRFIDIWGKEHWFSGIISKMSLNNEIVLQTITRDITQRKTIEKELEKYRNNLEILVKERTEELAASNEELVSTNEELHLQREELEAVLINLQNAQKQLVMAEKMASLGVLASGVAHEINNPLNFIKGGAFGIEQYIEENLEEHKDELFPLLEGINKGIDRAANIVKSLNHYNRSNDSNFIKCDIHTIIDNCLEILRNQISKRITIEKNFTKDIYLLDGNEGKLHQAMLNILSNAAQSIDGNGIMVIKTIVSDNNMTISITDSGCGISAQNMSKILDPFFTTKEPGEGTGLGLSITFNILEEHNGTIDFESKVGEGTTVKIILPLNKE